VSTLARAADDFIARVLLVTESPAEAGYDPSRLRAELLGELASLEQSPPAARLESQEIEHARFALAVWADEQLIESAWSGRETWAHDLLQMQLFHTNRGGDEFYERLSRLRPGQSEARLVFFLCLMFGFDGQLVGDEPARRTLMQQHFDMLRAAGVARDLITTDRLSPEAYALEVHLEPPSSGAVRRILLGWTAVAATTFALYWGVLWLMAQRVPLPPGS
jgi:type IV/VI secretion system ImpK/VasF family protein